jgi:hypothetical protein
MVGWGRPLQALQVEGASGWGLLLLRPPLLLEELVPLLLLQPTPLLPLLRAVMQPLVVVLLVWLLLPVFSAV